MTEILDCGHAPTPQGAGSGYAYFTPDFRMCYPCADEVQRAEIKTGVDRFVGYVDGDVSVGAHLVTWSGGMLGRVVGVQWGRTSRRFGGVSMVHVVAVVEGRRWHGKYAPDLGKAVRLRAYKSQ